jgi:hypothetical protein
LDIVLPNPSIIQSVKSVIELKRSDCAGGCFAVGQAAKLFFVLHALMLWLS